MRIRLCRRAARRCRSRWTTRSACLDVVEAPPTAAEGAAVPAAVVVVVVAAAVGGGAAELHPAGAGVSAYPGYTYNCRRRARSSR